MIRKCFVMMLLMGVVVGCAAVRPSQQDDPPVDFLSEEVAEAVEIINHRAERLPSGHVDVLLVCISKKEKKSIWFDWKTVFYDQRGIRVEESEWHTQQAKPKTAVMIRASSIRRDIENFRFLLRAPQ